MRLPLLVSALLMPAVAWFSQQGTFGPDIVALADRYPTLLLAAEYSYTIWGAIFFADLLFATWQLRGRYRRSDTLARVRPPATTGFLLTALWMPIASQQLFGLALAMIWAALGCLTYCAVVLSRDRNPLPGQRAWAWLPLSLHAGALLPAAFLDTARTAVAYRWLDATQMLPWTLGLLALAALLALWLNARMRGNAAYLLALLWGLAAVYVEQSEAAPEGATAAAWSALAVAALLIVQTIWLRVRAPHKVFSGHLSPGE